MEVNDSNFQKEVIEASKTMPVVVDFWAEWCGPCRMLGPIIERLAKEFNGKVKVVKLNVDDSQETSQQYEIMSIPAVKLFKDGQVKDEFVGVQPEQVIRKWIESHL